MILILIGFWNYKANIKYKEAENIQDFFKRVYTFLDLITQKYSNDNILIITHGSLGIPINCYFYGMPTDGNLLQYTLKNGEIRSYKYN